MNRSSRHLVTMFLGLSIVAGLLVLSLAQAPKNNASVIDAATPEPISELQSASELKAAPTAATPSTIPDETRGVWITNVASGVLFSPWGISRAMHQLTDMHFNTVYPVVWNRGKSFYHSDTLEKITGQAIDPLLALAHPITDPLGEMVRLGHQNKRQNRIRVIPWFEYGFMVPMDSTLAREHPDWLTTRQNGSRWLTEETFAIPDASAVGTEASSDTEQSDTEKTEEKTAPKGLFADVLKSGAPTHLGWLNPLHPNVQGLLLGMVEEVVSDYDVDGIQLDDHFSWPVEFGYDDYTVLLYKAEHRGQSPPSNPADPDWIRWRADKLSKFVNVLHAKVQAKCPSCMLSLSPNPAKFAYRFHLQDWQTWVNQGWVDELVVQVYRDDMEQFESELSKHPLQAARDRIPVSIGILTGTWRRPITFEQIKRQVESSRDRHFSGVSFFYWDTLWSYFTPEPPKQRRHNFQELMSDLAI
ncbi:MAG: family 10 glycosylhydrolase [Cyanobacteria bacterium P01_F01_bin.53]